MPKENPALHRYAVLLAACTVLLFLSGTVVTSNEERPGYSLGLTHAWFGAAVTLLLAALLVHLWRTKAPAPLRRLALFAFGLDLVLDILGIAADPLLPAVRIAHALLGQLFFSSAVAIAVLTSPAWNRPPEAAANAKALRFLALAMPAVVLLQVVLGAAHRHGVIGLAMHLLWALFVGVFLIPVIAAIFTAGQPSVRAAGVLLGIVTSVQILLGFTVFTLEAIDADPTLLIAATSIHAAAGAFTLAAAVVVALLVHHAIRNAPAPPVPVP